MVDYPIGRRIEGDFMQRSAREEYLLKQLWDWQESSRFGVLAGVHDGLLLQADETSRRLREL